MSGDHLVFISVASVLIISAINSMVLNRKHGWNEGEAFWFWGLLALCLSYLGFGVSAWLGRPALVVADLTNTKKIRQLIFTNYWLNRRRV